MGKFHDLINSEKPTLVDFSAEWCGPCQMMAPVLQELKRLVKNNANILKVDVDRNEKLASKFMIRSVPTLMIFQQGNVKWRSSGVIQANLLEHQLKEWMVNSVV